MKFTSTKEIERYYQRLINEGRIDEIKSSLQKSGVNTSNLPLVSEKELKEAADALKEYLLTHIRRYFASYSPVIDRRTGQLLDSLRVEVTNGSGKLSARVYFDSTKTIRDSLFPGGQQGDVVELLDQGWQVKKDVWFKDIEHFGHFDGVGFISAAIKDAESDSRFTNIQITYNGAIDD